MGQEVGTGLKGGGYKLHQSQEALKERVPPTQSEGSDSHYQEDAFTSF